MQDVAVEEGDGAQCLVLGGGGDIALGREVDDELLDFGDSHFTRMPFVVEQDVTADPVEVGFFGAQGVVFSADGVADLVEEFFVFGGGGGFLGYFCNVLHVDLSILRAYNLLILF